MANLNFIDLSGQRFHKLTVIERVPSECKGTRWLCVCDCGNETEVQGRNLKQAVNPVTSCGCNRSEDITGQIFNQLTVIRKTDKRDHVRAILWECRCDCGKIAYTSSSRLKDGSVKSCGCIVGEFHGLSETPEYYTWRGMIDRCHNPKSPGFINYGGRGIVVCKEWRKSLTSFLDHVGPRPSEKHSIDRIENNGNYEPGNVRWATKEVKANNTRANAMVTYKGDTLTVAQMARKHGVSYELLHNRLKRGVPPELAVIPFRPK